MSQNESFPSAAEKVTSTTHVNQLCKHPEVLPPSHLPSFEISPVVKTRRPLLTRCRAGERLTTMSG